MDGERAFTLVELLVVIAVVALMAGLLFPAFAGAKRRAKDTVSLSNLHQLGLASGLYHEATGEFPRMAAQLFPNFVRDSRILVSPNDFTSDGLAVRYLPSPEWIWPSRIRVTYAGAHELRSAWMEARALTIPGTTRGLFVDVSPLEFQTSSLRPEPGRYHRLVEDLSIVDRRFPGYPTSKGHCFVTSTLLDEYDEKIATDCD